MRLRIVRPGADFGFCQLQRSDDMRLKAPRLFGWRWQHVDVGLADIAEVVVDRDRAAEKADAQPGDHSDRTMGIRIIGIGLHGLVEKRDRVCVIQVVGSVERRVHERSRSLVGRPDRGQTHHKPRGRSRNRPA
jgi:hypothetical protein